VKGVRIFETRRGAWTSTYGPSSSFASLAAPAAPAAPASSITASAPAGAVQR
jgi:hypothetical protein